MLRKAFDVSARNFDDKFGSIAGETPRNFYMKWAGGLRRTKTTENLDRVGRSIDLPDAYGLLARSLDFE